MQKTLLWYYEVQHDKPLLTSAPRKAVLEGEEIEKILDSVKNWQACWKGSAGFMWFVTETRYFVSSCCWWKSEENGVM